MRRDSSAGARRHSTCATSTSPTACAAATGRCCAASRFTIGRGESFGLVGESGCGKSTAAMAAMRYLPRNGRIAGGSITVDGQDLLGAARRASCASCAPTTVSMVYQDPGARAQPVAPGRPPGGRGVRDRRRVEERGAPTSAEAMLCAASRSPTRSVHAALPAPALRRHAAARRDRHGAGHRTRRC